MTAMKSVPLLKRWLFLVFWCTEVILGGCGIPATSTQTPNHAPTSQPASSPGTAAICQTRQLLPAAGQTKVALSNEGVQISFENQSQVLCTLTGYPTLQLLSAQQKPWRAQIMQSTSSYLYRTRPPQTITLHPGQKAYFAPDGFSGLSAFLQAK